ncbi:MAG TPA: FtsX-like permease family protein [Alphaproteobacteria bacterium]
MFETRSDLPLRGDASRRFLPWLVALNVYLAALALAGLMALGDAVSTWDKGLTGSMTVQIPAPVAPASKIGDGEIAGDNDARVAKALELLRATPGVASAQALSRAEMATLMEPWLGSGALVAELPLPALVDVQLRPAAGVNAGGLESVLAAAVPGATVDDHKKWLDRLVLLVHSVELVAGAVVLLVAGAAIATVIFITRTGLSLHHEVISLLHVIGAQDDYIARQFQSQALALGLKGGAIGFALAAVTVVGLGMLASRLGSQLLPPLSIGPLQWLALAVLPLGVALIGMATARVTVMRTLARLP